MVLCLKGVKREFVSKQHSGGGREVIVRSRCTRDKDHDGKCRDKDGNLRDNH